MSSKPRAKKCKAPGCGQKFHPQRMGQIACSPMCAVAVGQQIRLKAEKVSDRQRKERLMTLSDWRKRAQAAFNAWIVLRDAALPCVSCGRWHEGRWHAGHFYSTGARPELRFDEANVHKQCAPCNTHLHGNLVLYRAGLLQRISLSELMRLEGPNPPRHDTADSLKELAAHYRAKTRALLKEQG